MHRIIFIILGVAPLIGCSRNEPVDTNNLIVAISAAPVTLDPRYSTDAIGMRVNSLIFSSLVKTGPELEIAPDAAEKWSYQNNSFRFLLKPNLKFSNGRAIEREDILFSFQEYQKLDNLYANELKDVTQVQVKNEKNRLLVILKIKRYSATLLNQVLPSVKLLPSHELKNDPKLFSRTLLGTGSYKLLRNNENEIVLEKNSFSHELPKTSKITFKIIHDDLTRFQKILQGNIDITYNEIPYSKLKYFESHSKFKVHKFSGLTMNYLLPNFKDPLLAQINVRQAISLALNREDIIKYKFEGLAHVATSLLAPNIAYFNKSLPSPEYNLALAREIVSSLPTQPELTLKTSNNPQVVENAKVIAAQLNKAGFKIKLQSYEWATYYNDVKSGNFQLASMRWVGVVDPDIYRVAFLSQEVPPKGRNRGSYINVKLDKMLIDGLSIENFNKRRELYNEAQKLIYNDLAVVPLWYEMQTAVVHNRIKNFVPTRNGDFTTFIHLQKVLE